MDFFSYFESYEEFAADHDLVMECEGFFNVKMLILMKFCSENIEY